MTRRAFLGALALVAARPLRALAGTDEPHPDPRPGITAARVLGRAQLHEKSASRVFDLVRRMPQVADGIRCRCGCAELPGMRSLLSCFEGDGMAQHCQVCQGEARLAYRLHRRGKSLAQIRAAIDAEFA
ncbi:MAG TPA: PCYCGC motif-containing (lipo)protein [Gemmatimonadaceae bacterium]|nr:PCYCGC motif-containing (lipo)protein [Gemmatimonadaceae bacterium]